MPKDTKTKTKEEIFNETREDVLTGRTVIISPKRGVRPRDTSECSVKEPKKCPFCSGNEEGLPKKPNGEPNIILEYKDYTKWFLRVIPNKYPALCIEGEGKNRGAHEVIIITPNHDETIKTMPLFYVENMLGAYKDRITDLRKDSGFEYFCIFMNYGEKSGASLEHPHSQLIATPYIPSEIKNRLRNAKEFYEQKKESLFEYTLKEHEEKRLIINQNEDFVAFAPWASRYQYEVRIFPTHQKSNFEEDHEKINNLAKLVQDITKRLDKTISSLNFNLCLYTIQLQQNNKYPEFCWHMEFLPRQTILGGYELSTGDFIHSVLPEQAAEELRNAKID